MKRLSEAEIIKELNDVLLHHRETEKVREAIQGLLDLYNRTKGQLENKTYLYNKLDINSTKIMTQLSKDNLELQNELEKEKEKNKKIYNGEMFTRKQVEIVQKAIKEGIEEQVPKEMKNFISKDKIREKIEKLEADLSSNPNYGLLQRIKISSHIIILKEVLEEENDV